MRLPYPYVRLQKMLDFPDDWDEAGAKRISEKSATIASIVLYAIQYVDTWFLMPEHDGGLSVSTEAFPLSGRDYEVDIVISPEGFCEVDVYDVTDTVASLTLNADIPTRDRNEFIRSVSTKLT